MTDTKQISLMPEPGTPEYDNLLKWMRRAYADPRQVNFRREVTRDGANIGFLTQGGTLPLPDVKDPVRKAIEVQVTLLVEGHMDDPADFLEEAEDALRGLKLGVVAGRVIDVHFPDDPTEVTILDAANYTAGDHFTNPIRDP